jgi:hypothetical protein
MLLNSTTEALERKLIDLQALIADAADDADRMADTDASWDVGLELLDARKAVQAALDALERATAPKVGPVFPPTIVRSAALDKLYAEVDTWY